MLIEKIKGGSAGEAGAFREFTHLAETNGRPGNYAKMTPWANAKLLGRGKTGPSLLTRYISLGAEVGIIRAAKAPIPAVRSGVASYMRHCDLLARPPFPPTADTAQLWARPPTRGRPSANAWRTLRWRRP